MVILFQTTGRLGTIPGGIQRHIEALQFDHSTDESIDLSSVDMVVITNAENGSVSQAQNCIRQRKLFVWWPLSWWHRDTALNQDSSDRAQFLAYHSAYIIAQSRYEAKKLNNPKTIIIPPMVDTVFKNNHIDRRFVHTNGRYDRFKRHAFVLKACKDLNLPCITAGFIQDKAYYDECGLLEGTLLGLATPEQLANIYNQSRIYVCASLAECNSGSVHEAIACGCCVLADGRNHDGIHDLDKKGVILYHDDTEFYRLLPMLYQNPEPQENIFYYVDQVRSMFLRLANQLKSGVLL